MTMHSCKLGESSIDGLVSGLNPKTSIGGRTIRKLSEAGVLKRGTIMSISSEDNKLVVLGSEAAEETLTPDCILADDVEVGTEEDVTVAVYTAGCFDMDKCTVADRYTVSAADYDAMRVRNIVFKNAKKF